MLVLGLFVTIWWVFERYYTRAKVNIKTRGCDLDYMKFVPFVN